MIDISFVENEVLNWSKPIRSGSHIIVPTNLIYPSSSPAMIHIEGGQSHFMLSDGGGAVAHLHQMGAYHADGISLLEKHVSNTVWRIDGAGWITTREPVERDEFLSSVFELAATSLAASKFLLKKVREKHFSPLKAWLEKDLSAVFGAGLQKKGKLLGTSNKHHTFDFLGRKSNYTLAIDAVHPEPGDINKTTISHMDIKKTGDTSIKQMIIYDDKEEWKSSDLTLLGFAMPPIPYSIAKQELLALG